MAGIFLDASLSMINHSCVPNAFIGFDKRTAMLRAERDIALNDEIEISYIGMWRPLACRETGLTEQTTLCRNRRDRRASSYTTSSANAPAALMTWMSTRFALPRPSFI